MDLALPLPIRGLILGFTIAAAVGPITLLVMRRTLDHGFRLGLASGMGVAAADTTYGAVAAFGLTAITAFLVSIHVLLGIVGGAVIVWIGIRTMRSRPTTAAPDAARPGMLSAFLSIWGLTLTNPLTILLFAGVFAGIGLAAGSSFLDATVLTLAVGAGSTFWWIVLVSILAVARDRLSTTVLVWINRISGAALVVFGVYAVVSALQG